MVMFSLRFQVVLKSCKSDPKFSLRADNSHCVIVADQKQLFSETWEIAITEGASAELKDLCLALSH